MPKRKSPPSWMTADQQLLNELERQLDAGGPAVVDRAGVPVEALRKAFEALRSGARAPEAETAALACFLRPCAPLGQEPCAAFWRRRLALASPDLQCAARAMARIGSGMGWLVSEHALVAQVPDLPRRPKARFEDGATAKVVDALPDLQTGLVFLTVESGEPLPPPVALGDADSAEPYVAALGYGAGGLFVAPGRILAAGRTLRHDCATPDGSAGALLLDLNSGAAAGTHLGGCLNGVGIAAAAIRKAMARLKIQPAEPETLESAEEEDFLEAAKLTPADYADRKGYDARFLGSSVPMPKPIGQFENDAVVYAGPKGKKSTALPYTHFSVMMSKSRKLCLCAAVNIDGKQQKELRRADKADRWLFDPRVDKAAQCGRPIYRGGQLDLGHMVRRLDPVWGAQFERANDDTFHFTNACPQHKCLNRQVWNDLEDYILKNTDENHLKVCVFTGPVLTAQDPAYRGIKLPQQFWKVAAMTLPNGKLHAAAYILSQADMITGLEFAFGEFRTYQIPLAQLEKMTQLDFGSLRKYDPRSKASNLEAAAVCSEIRGPEDVRV